MHEQPLHFLFLEPYFGGSHRAFVLGLQKYLDFSWTIISLPARKWKMRMQLAAPWMAEQVIALVRAGNQYDGILCSTFLDVAVFRALLLRAGIDLPLALYFHENQFSYPGQVPDPGLHQFTAINFTSALTADRIAFNSEYNRKTFFAGVHQYLKRATDTRMGHLEQEIEAKSCILFPGLDFSFIDGAVRQRREHRMPVIVWNHRWEHDKGPEDFFSVLFRLAERGIDFRLIVLGQRFRNSPSIFTLARENLSRRLIHFGYVEDRNEYGRLLVQGDLVVSTALHEFFGMAVLEAVRAGNYPLVPDRLAYREIFPRQYRYSPVGLHAVLRYLLQKTPRLDRSEIDALTGRFAWPALAAAYESWLIGLVEERVAG